MELPHAGAQQPQIARAPGYYAARMPAREDRALRIKKNWMELAGDFRR
jgi:hypothetical protein